MATMINSYDEKIMNFDISEGFEAFINLFDEEEIKEMRAWLEEDDDEGYGYCYDFLDMPYTDGTYKTEQEKNEYIVMDYVKEWLVQNIRGNTRDGSEQLFNILYNM